MNQQIVLCEQICGKKRVSAKTMEFVVEMLETIFHKSSVEANHIMLHVHMRGSGVCGVYPHEVAETKVAVVHRLARAAGYPLRCSLQVV